MSSNFGRGVYIFVGLVYLGKSYLEQQISIVMLLVYLAVPQSLRPKALYLNNPVDPVYYYFFKTRIHSSLFDLFLNS